MGVDKYVLSAKDVKNSLYGLSKAKRPFNSRLAKDKLQAKGFKTLPTWQDALKRYLQEIQ